MHPLLERQLRLAGFNLDTLPADTKSWQAFLLRIEKFYINADAERLQNEQALQSLRLASEQSTTAAISNVLSNEQGDSLSAIALFNALKEGICIFNPDGHTYFINQYAKNALKITIEHFNTLLAQFEIHKLEDHNLVIENKEIIQVINSGKALYDPNARLLTMNPALYVSVSFNPIVDNQTLKGIVVIFNDVGFFKKTEQDLLAAKDNAERASRAKSQFLSSMSHELRTPMNAILGYSEILKEDLNIPIDELDENYAVDMKQYVENILKAGWHLLELINKVLDLTRIEANKLEVNIERVELIELVKECISLILPLAEKKQITVKNESAVLAPHYVLMDRGRLKQVIINLLSNGVKYNREKGSLTIKIEKPTVEYVHLSVIDTGVGLTEAQKEKVFEPFTRFTGVNLIEGTGIGLTITKLLLEVMDGRIDVESKINVGSRFWIELPTGEIAETQTLSTDMRKFILLYIEDSRTNVSLVAQILKSRPDIALMSAQTGELGLELAIMHSPDVILLDINLPGMNGYEVLSQLQCNEKTKNIPVLALTAVDNTNNSEQSQQAGFFTYIVKPLNIKQFLKSIDAALEHSLKFKNPF